MVPNLPLDRSTMTFLLLILEENLLMSGAKIAKYLIKDNKLSIFVQNIIKKIIKCKAKGLHPGGRDCSGCKARMPMVHAKARVIAIVS